MNELCDIYKNLDDILKYLEEHPEDKDKYPVCNGREHFFVHRKKGGSFSFYPTGPILHCPVYLKKTSDKWDKDSDVNFDKIKSEPYFTPDVIRIVKSFPQSDTQNMIITGPVGVGKTMMARSLNNSLQEAIYISANELYDLFFDMNFSEQRQNAQLKYTKLLENEFIIIDDIGDEKQTEKEVFNSGFKRLLDEYNGRIVITTNLKKNGILTRYGDKIYSRLMQNTKIISVMAPDYRTQSHEKESTPAYNIECSIYKNRARLCIASQYSDKECNEIMEKIFDDRTKRVEYMEKLQNELKNKEIDGTEYERLIRQHDQYKPTIRTCDGKYHYEYKAGEMVKRTKICPEYKLKKESKK